MKNKNILYMNFFTLLILICTINKYCFTQTNNFAPIGATWHYEDIYDIDYDDTIYITGYNKVESISDTLIEDKICRKLKFTYVNADGLLMDAWTNYHYLYEDNEKVYFHLEDKFLLLYDLSGENWYAHDIYYGSGDSTLIIVDSVTTEIYDWVPLKTIHIKYDFSPYLFFVSNKVVEKIGPPCYLFLYNGGDDSFPPSNLRCYQDDDIDIHINPGTACDELIPEITALQTISPINIQIYVNENGVYLQNVSEPVNVTLINVLGEVVNSLSISTDTRINCSNLSKGIYIVSLEINNNVYSKKIVI